MQKWTKKILLITIGIVIFIVVLAILFISPITKYLVEKYDEQYTGRQITMDWAYVNPFTGYIHFNDLKIYEYKSDSIFFQANGTSLNMAMFKLLSKTYEISSLTFDEPYGTIIQSKKNLNFEDLIEKFSSKKDSTRDTTKAPVHFNILNIKINNGEFHYHDTLLPINYFIKKVNIESSGKRWDADSIAAKFAFMSGMGSGDIKGDFAINVKNNDYRLNVIVNKFDLQIIEQYLKDLANYGSFTAILDADMHSTGNLIRREKVTNWGRLAISDFHFGKTRSEDYLSFDKLSIAINELSPSRFKYNYDSIALFHPYFKYERYDKLDNLQTMFGRKGAKIKAAQADEAQFNLIIEVVEYIRMLSRNFFKSNYKINKLAVYKADLRFNDFTGTEKFSMDLNPLYITADSIDKSHKRAKVYLNSEIKPFGQASATLSIDPKDSTDFDFQYNLQKIPASMFNAYTIAYTSFPLDRGTIEFNGKWRVRNKNIQSENHLLIIDPRPSKRVRGKDKKWIPMPLVMAFIRERGNVIDYNIPISGNLNNPKFHLRDVVFDLLRNIFVKPPTTPYGIQVKNVETEIEKLLTLKWQMRQNLFLSNQEKFLERMATFLKRNPDASIGVYPQVYAAKEKEYILFFEAKKKYFSATNNINAQSLSEKDSITVDRMSNKDASFLRYLDKNASTSKTFTVQQKCSRLIGNEVVDTKFDKLTKERENIFMSYFKKEGVEKQVKIYKMKEVVPYNGFSFYKIDYKGELPKSLIRAYERMNELNEQGPRKKFENKRKKNPGLFN